MGSGCLLRAPLVLLRAPLVLKNTAQKFLIHKTFWWWRNICPEPCPGTFYQYFRGGAALSFFGAERGSVEIFGVGAGRGSHFCPGRAGACIPAKNLSNVIPNNRAMLAKVARFEGITKTNVYWLTTLISMTLTKLCQNYLLLCKKELVVEKNMGG